MTPRRQDVRRSGDVQVAAEADETELAGDRPRRRVLPRRAVEWNPVYLADRLRPPRRHGGRVTSPPIGWMRLDAGLVRDRRLPNAATDRDRVAVADERHEWLRRLHVREPRLEEWREQVGVGFDDAHCTGEARRQRRRKEECGSGLSMPYGLRPGEDALEARRARRVDVPPENSVDVVPEPPDDASGGHP